MSFLQYVPINLRLAPILIPTLVVSIYGSVEGIPTKSKIYLITGLMLSGNILTHFIGWYGSTVVSSSVADATRRGSILVDG